MSEPSNPLDGVRKLVQRRLPEAGDSPIEWFGAGLENEVFLVGGDLVVRIRKEPDPLLRATAVRHESALLAIVGRISPVPVPEPVFTDPAAGALAYRLLPGVPLREYPVDGSARLAAPLAGLLDRLHAVPIAEVRNLVPVDNEPLTVWLADTADDYRDVAARLDGRQRRAVEDFLARTPPARPDTLTLCHNDLGAEHLLVDPDTGMLTGVIDWSDASIADPAYDLALILRDLGPQVYHAVLEGYSHPFDDTHRERAAFYARCALLEDLAHGVRTGERRYLDANLALMNRTFEPGPEGLGK